MRRRWSRRGSTWSREPTRSSRRARRRQPSWPASAGVYLVARTYPLFEAAPQALTVVAVIGGFTAIFAATMGLASNDIKRVLAYSTVSQLGYMMLALGAGSLSAGMFHLVTHAFFKALLFLAAGSGIFARGDNDSHQSGG